MDDNFTLDELLDMADVIALRIRSGDFPKQDEFGRYVFSDHDLDLSKN